MKNLNFLRTLMVLASAFMLIQCTSDLEIPDPIAGPPGLDGIDGVDGVDGVDGTASCVACHSSATREPIVASFAVSLHGSGSTFARGASASCAQCHGEEGYIDYITTGAVREYSLELIGVDSLGFAVYDTINPYPNVSRMNCTTCHDRHSSFDFENDGFDYALRNIDAVTLVIDNATVIDFEGASNNCITCHQPRNSYPVPGGTDSVSVTSSRYGPHHGPQSTMLEGIMAANIPGSEVYPAVGSATHRTGSSCVACHMGESTDINEGMHSWNPTEEACIACHPNGAPDEISGFTADYTTLQNLLIAEGALTASGSAVPGTYSAEVGQALWNFRTLLEDKSKGIHNPAYTRALLKNSIEALQN
jgi:hypothetical protein